MDALVHKGNAMDGRENKVSLTNEKDGAIPHPEENNL